MKKPLTIISTDWHLSKNNIDQVKDLVRQKIELAHKLGIKKIISGGDIFNSRKAQEQSVLNAFGEILDEIEDADLKLWSIVGNHDKVDLDNESSYLTEFKHHPGFILIEYYGALYFGENEDRTSFTLLSFFKDEKYKTYLSEIIENSPKYKNHFLVSHQAVTGVRNNDGSLVENNLKLSDFQKFDTVFMGHYHNRSKVGNVRYIGSLCQNNFGEDTEKGFIVVYDDGSYEFVQSKFKKFEKIIFDLDKTSVKEFKHQIQSIRHQINDSNIRIELTGGDEKLSSVNFDDVKEMGFDVKLKRKDIEAHIEVAEEGGKLEFNTESILKEFDSFCDQEEIKDKEIGFKYLTKILGV